MCSNLKTLESNMQIIETSNERLLNRNIPSMPMQPYLSVRPVMTKYSILPIVDPRAVPKVPMQVQPTYNMNTMFNPGSAQSPWSGYASNVNVESDLRNQIFALQRCSQSVFVPSTTSDLYQSNMPQQQQKQNQQPYPNLFKKEIYSDFNPNCEQVAKGTFNNHTRQQLKNLSENQE